MGDIQKNSRKVLWIYSIIVLLVGLVLGYILGKWSANRSYTHVNNTVTTCKTCKEIKTCDEAKRLLAAGCTDLDRDHDGVPCENLCGRKK